MAASIQAFKPTIMPSLSSPLGLAAAVQQPLLVNDAICLDATGTLAFSPIEPLLIASYIKAFQLDYRSLCFMAAKDQGVTCGLEVDLGLLDVTVVAVRSLQSSTLCHGSPFKAALRSRKKRRAAAFP